MKYTKKFLSYIIAAAMAVSFIPSAALAEPESERMRPSIINPVEAGENYTGGIAAIDWGDTDWGAFKDVDWTDADIMNAEELAARLEESGVNALAFEDELTYEDGVLSVGDTPLQEDDLGGITLEGNTITFPKGDTALIIPIKNFGALEAVLDIPDDSNVAVIAVAKDDVQPILNYTIWGHDSRDTFTVNTNKNGNLAVVNLAVSEYSGQGMLMNGELNINGTGTVAVVGGKSGSSSIGIYADSVNVNGASLIAAGDFSTTTSRGIDASKGLDYSDERTGGITADNGALIIGVGGNALGGSVGIETMNISAKNGSEIYAYGGSVPPADTDEENDMRTIGLQIMEGVTKRTITADNGSKIYARAGNGEYPYGMTDYYTDFDLGENDEITPSEIVYGGLEFVIDESENAEPSEIILSGSYEAYHQRRTHNVGIDKSQYKVPAGNITVMGSLETDGSDAILSYFNSREHSYMYASSDNIPYLSIKKSGEADYYLKYDPDEGALYDDNNEEIENFPGVICDGATLTLTNDFHFETGCDTGLYLFPGTTLVVPEGVTASIMSGDRPNQLYSTALWGNEDCSLVIDGTLAVTSRSAGYQSEGILCDALSISGTGTLYATSGDVIDASTPYAWSTGINAEGDVSVRGTYVKAYSGYVSGILDEDDDYPHESAGLEVIDGSVYVGDGGVIDAKSIGGEGDVISYGCHMLNVTDITADGGFLSATASSVGSPVISAGIAINTDTGSAANLRAVNDGWIAGGSDNNNTEYSYGLYEEYAEDDSGAISITVDNSAMSSVSLQGSSAAVNLINEFQGNYDVHGYGTGLESEPYDVTFDMNKFGYVDADGEVAKIMIFKGKAMADYGIYYDEESGFRKNTKDGEVLESVPYGISADGNTLTLDYALFSTTYETALRVGEGVTVNVPEDSVSVIRTRSSAKDKIADGILLAGNNTLNVDGDLRIEVSGSNEENYAIQSQGLATVSGNGIITTSGGSTLTQTPTGIRSHSDLTFDGKVRVNTGKIDVESDTDEKTTLIVKGGAFVNVDDNDYINRGMIIENMLVEGYGDVSVQDGSILVVADEENPGEIHLKEAGIIVVENLESAAVASYDDTGLGIDTDVSVVAEGVAMLFVYGNPAVSHVKAADNVMVSGGEEELDSYELQYDDEKHTYIVPQTGEAAKNATFMFKGYEEPSPSPEPTAEPTVEPTSTPAATVEPTVSPAATAEPTATVEPTSSPAAQSPSPAPTKAPAPSRGSGSGRGSSGTSAAKPTASPTPTAVPEATESPEPTEAPSATDKPEPTDAPEVGGLPFVDVNSSDWFYNAVKAAYTEGLVSGVTETEFAPNVTLTRGMLTAIIGRLGGAETTDGSTVFTDVDANAYYAPYVAWAAENGIVSGFGDGTFRPDESVTREQTAAIIWRYMQYIGEDVSAGEDTNILSYTDAADVSEYAIPAIQWACGDGIISGYPDGSLAPKSGITRAEFAAMISKIALL